ncbi:MAG: extracellular solute-binding protein [Caldilineaceae bacterium]
MRWRSGRWRPLFLAGAVVILLGGVLAACWQATSTAITMEDITVYSSIPQDLVGDYLADFQAQNPNVEVTLVNEVTLSLINRLLEEKDDPQADVIWGLAVTNMLLAEWNYLLAPYATHGLDHIAPAFYDTNSPPNWVGISVRSLVLCVNPTVLEQQGLPLPQSWADLVDPAYQGHLIMPTPGSTSVGYLLIAAILQLYGDIDGWSYLEQLHQNVGQYVTNVTNVCPAVAAGDYAIGLSYDYRAVQQKVADPQIEIVYPLEGTGWEAEVNALVRKDDIKPAAKLFLDWAISDAAMRHYAHDRSIITSDTTVETPAGFPPNVKSFLLDQDIPWLAANRVRIQEEWLTTFGDEAAQKTQ